MRLLWISTKPPLPAIDGGRLLQELTLRALAERGVEVTLVCPVEPGFEAPAALAELCRPVLVESTPPSRVAVLSSREPAAIARHRRSEVGAAVAKLLGEETFDAVHVEQVHALPQAEGAVERGLRVVLRAQNVESDLWQTMASLGGAKGLLARREAPRLAAWEGEAVRRASAVAALTESDAEGLRRLAGGGGSVVRVPAPFPSPGPVADEALAGAPAVVLLGSGGWLPNQDAARWFGDEIWPVVREALPAARLHRFDGDEPSDDPQTGVTTHLRPADSRTAFAPGAVFAVPLRIASGVRMKILESFARGLPVVASPAAVAGLDAEAGRQLLVAEDPQAFAAAFARLNEEPELAGELVAAGRELLATHHRPEEVAGRLVGLYEGDGA